MKKKRKKEGILKTKGLDYRSRNILHKKLFPNGRIFIIGTVKGDPNRLITKNLFGKEIIIAKKFVSAKKC